jgi:hypothetical protein
MIGGTGLRNITSVYAVNRSESNLPPDAEILPRRGTTGVIFALKTSFIFSMSSHLGVRLGDE